MNKYRLVIVVPFDGLDVVSARMFLNKHQEIIKQLPNAEVKLQQMVATGPPKGIDINT